ncbi:MAG: Smr/MutS family protein [Myxococcaceae bacterium]|nr:Smr/MutS family protein [Myxococcaceae bacterium]MCI0673672.1 Smr/MutS family protein [Myxococcaceae bacterium]
MSGEEPPDWEPEEPVELPIDGNLDLHTFHPRDVPALLEEYLGACRERGILEVRIVHGKGTGALRRRVHTLLGEMPGVESFRSADAFDGGWGATWVRLLPPQSSQK